MEKTVDWNNRVGDVPIERFTFLLFHCIRSTCRCFIFVLFRSFLGFYSYQLAVNHLNHLIGLFTYIRVQRIIFYFFPFTLYSREVEHTHTHTAD